MGETEVKAMITSKMGRVRERGNRFLEIALVELRLQQPE